MSVGRGDYVQCALQTNLPGGAAEEIGTTNDVGDALVCVVDDDGELVGKNSVPAADHDIAHRPDRQLAVTLKTVFQGDDLIVDPESRSRGRGRAGSGRFVPASAGISPLLVLQTKPSGA